MTYQTPMSGKILLVDDEPDLLENMAINLNQEGYEVITAVNGREGVDKAIQEHPDLILLDVMMPVMDGFEACRQIRDNSTIRHIPILLLTALSETDKKVEGLEAGADDFIGKPFVDVELRARVRAFLRTKKLWDELSNNYRKLAELEKLKEDLTYMIVHDLKSPFSAVIGGMSFLASDLEKETQISVEHKGIIKNALFTSRCILGFIQNLLDIGRMEEKKLPLAPVPVNLEDLVADGFTMIRPMAAKKNIILKHHPKSGLSATLLDRDLIQRVLINLVSNSIKFSEENGTVEVYSGLSEDKEWLELVVRDHGYGIPAQYVGKVFDKYFQCGETTLNRKGHGIGLAFCRMAVEAHGGKIWAESPDEKGSSFHIRLPIRKK